MIDLTQQPLRKGVFHRPLALTRDHWLFLVVVAAMVWNIIAPTVAHSLAVITIGPVTLYTYDLLIIVVAWLSVLAVLAEISDPRATIHRVIIVVVLLYLAYQIVVIMPIAIVKTDQPAYSVLRTLSPRFSLVYVIYFYLRGLRVVSSEFIVRVLNFAAVCLAIFAAGRYVVQGPVGYSTGSEDRLREVFGGAALFFAWLILTRFFLYRVTITSWVLIMTGVVGVVLVNYRMVYLGLAAAFVIVLAGTERGRRRLPVALFMVGLSVLAVALSPATIRDNAIYSVTRVVDPQTPTAIDRVERYSAGLEYFRAHPLGDYAISGRYYLVDFGNTPEMNYEPHNFVIQILAKEGLVALAFYAFLLGSLLVIGFRNRGRDPVSALALSYLVFYLVFCSFTTHFYSPANAPFFALPVSLILWRDAVLKRAPDEQELSARDSDEENPVASNA